MAEEPGDQYSVSSDELQVSPDDVLPLRDTPEGLSYHGTPGPDYHGPVSTPAPLRGNDSLTFNTLQNQYRNICSKDSQSMARSHHQPQINYPYYMDTHNKATRTNMEYYHVLPTPRDQRQNWLSNLTSPPINELHRDYEIKCNRQYIFSKRMSKYPTLGERALVEGWERNTRSLKDPKSSKLSSGTDINEYAITHAFPPSRLVLSRAKTTGYEQLHQSDCHDGSTNLNNTRWYHPTSDNISSNRWKQESLSTLFKRFPTDFPSEHRSFREKPKNYLSFMTNSRRSGLNNTWCHREGSNVELPNIHVTSTVLAALKQAEGNIINLEYRRGNSSNIKGGKRGDYNVQTSRKVSEHLTPLDTRATSHEVQLIRKRYVLRRSSISNKT